MKLVVENGFCDNDNHSNIYDNRHAQNIRYSFYNQNYSSSKYIIRSTHYNYRIE